MATTPAGRCSPWPSTPTGADRPRCATSPSAPGLPQPYLEQILLALKGAGLVRSKRGVGGGYVLARPPAEITLGQIVSAVDGPIVAGDFGEPHQNGACDHEGQCVLLSVWADVGGHMRDHLDSFTLADMVTRARGPQAGPGPSGVPRPPRPPADRLTPAEQASRARRRSSGGRPGLHQQRGPREGLGQVGVGHHQLAAAGLQQGQVGLAVARAQHHLAPVGQHLRHRPGLLRCRARVAPDDTRVAPVGLGQGQPHDPSPGRLHVGRHQLGGGAGDDHRLDAVLDQPRQQGGDEGEHQRPVDLVEVGADEGGHVGRGPPCGRRRVEGVGPVGERRCDLQAALQVVAGELLTVDREARRGLAPVDQEAHPRLQRPAVVERVVPVEQGDPAAPAVHGRVAQTGRVAGWPTLVVSSGRRPRYSAPGAAWPLGRRRPGGRRPWRQRLQGVGRARTTTPNTTGLVGEALSMAVSSRTTSAS